MKECNKPSSARLKQLHFARRIYFPRIIGLGLGSISVASVFLEQNTSTIWWVLLFLGSFIWPHYAYSRLKRHPSPAKSEITNLMFDSFICALFIPVMQFSLLPSAVMLSMLSFDNLSIGGKKLFVKGFLIQIIAILVGVITVGIEFNFEATMQQVYSCLPMLIGYPIFIGYSTNNLSLQLRRSKKQLSNLNSKDCLTQVANRSHWESITQAAFLRSNRSHLDAAIIIANIDNFNHINQKHGHFIGDEVLKRVAKVLHKNIAVDDLIGRVNGNEFGVLTINSTPGAVAAMAERLRKTVEELDLGPLCPEKLTISIGVSDIHQGMKTSSEWLASAEEAVLIAKKLGKNQLNIIGQ